MLACRGKAKACVQQELKGVKLDTNVYICFCLLACRGKAKFVGFVLSTCLILTHVIASGVISYRDGLSIYT